MGYEVVSRAKCLFRVCDKLESHVMDGLRPRLGMQKSWDCQKYGQ